MARYAVREAILVPGANGSTWRVTFAPMRDTEGDEIVVMIPPATLDEMTFADTYTPVEIEALRVDPAV
jgi:hypothetical protein